MSRFSIIQRGEILGKTNNKCACCGKGLTVDTVTIDHYIPSSKGGCTRDTNLYPLCENCNHNKRNKIYEPENVYKYLPYSYIHALEKEYIEWIDNISAKIRKNTARIIVLVDNKFLNLNFDYRKNIDKDEETIEFGRKINKHVYKEHELSQGYERLFIHLKDIKFDTALIDSTKQSVVMLVTKGNTQPDLTSMYELYKVIQRKER